MLKRKKGGKHDNIFLRISTGEDKMLIKIGQRVNFNCLFVNSSYKMNQLQRN